MANNEIRIPITVELQAKTPKKVGQPTITKPTTPQTTPQPKRQESSVGQSISAGLLIDSTKKLISASGGAEITTGIELGVRYGTLVARSVVGDPTAMIALTADLMSEVLKYVQRLKQEAQVSNQAIYNKIKSGQILLGSSNTSTSENLFGKITYNQR